MFGKCWQGHSGGKIMELVNQIYNGDFLLAQESHPDFPDGWQRTGGDSSTLWEWIGPPQGPRAIGIHHPGGPKAGIGQAFEVSVQAGDNQRWELQLTLAVHPAGTPCFARINMGAGGIAVFSFSPTEEPQVFTRVFETKVGIPGLRLELGILGVGDLTIHQVEAFRLYPLRVLRLDEKGQLYIRHVESIGQIQKPVPVQMISPIPIPVEVKATITGDIRALTPARDGVRMYSSSGGPLGSTPDGSLQVQLSGHRFWESSESVTATVSPDVTGAVDVASFSVFTFAVLNRGIASAFIQVEVSPDGLVWAADAPEQEVAAGTLSMFTPTLFLRFNRLKFRALTASTLTVWFQAQS